MEAGSIEDSAGGATLLRGRKRSISSSSDSVGDSGGGGDLWRDFRILNCEDKSTGDFLLGGSVGFFGSSSIGDAYPLMFVEGDWE